MKACSRSRRSRACTSAPIRAGRIEIGTCSARRKPVSASATTSSSPTVVSRRSGPMCVCTRRAPVAIAAAICVSSTSIPASAKPEMIELPASIATAPRRSPSSRLSRARAVDGDGASPGTPTLERCTRSRCEWERRRLIDASTLLATHISIPHKIVTSPTPRAGCTTPRAAQCSLFGPQPNKT